jgi:hypothetical protein
MKKFSYLYRQQGLDNPVLVSNFTGSGLDLCEGFYPPAIEFKINHPDIQHLWVVWQMLRKIDLSTCPNLTELELFGNLLLDDITLNIANPATDMNNIISRTVDLPGGVMNVTRETTGRKNYDEFADRIKSLCYKIIVL